MQEAMVEVPAKRGEGAPCLVCGGAVRPWHEVNGCAIVRCGGCGFRFVRGPRGRSHVETNFGDAYFSGGGAGYPDYVADGHLLRERGRRYARILARHMRPGRALDIGAAAGFILRGLVDSGWSGRGLEPNRNMAAFGQQRLGLQIDCADIESYDPGERFDLIAMLQTIMHYYDVRRACTVAASMTKPGGYWLIEACDPDSLTGRVLGRDWHDYNPPSVLQWFSPRVLGRLLRAYGFEEVAHGLAPKVISAAHAKSVLRYRLGNGRAGRAVEPLLSLVPDRLSIPYPGDDIYWVLFRKPS